MSKDAMIIWLMVVLFVGAIVLAFQNWPQCRTGEVAVRALPFGFACARKP